jgi:uncharacterized alkaline shock family protein YloU
MSSVKTHRPTGSLKISKNVIVTIARTSTLETKGVASLAEPAMGASRAGGVFYRGFGKRAIRAALHDDFAELDISVNLEPGARIPDVCAAVQSAVKENVQTMTGVAVSKVNIKVMGVVFPAN